MAYTPRDERPGYHHVVTRGNNKQPIFLCDDDREYFLRRLNATATKHGWEILAYCLMGNHYHLVIKTGDAGLARGMCELNTGHAAQFNSTHGRINHLFGKRYWSEFLDEGHLFNAIRYVVQNPRRAGVTGALESHAWTSYRAAIGLAFTIARFARGELLALFGRTPSEGSDRFVAFCNAPVPSSGAPDGRGQRQPP